jgi:cytochrome c biogenesis protein
VPGSLLPQRPLNAAKTAQYIAAHGTWGRFLNSLGMFDVFGTAWFAAIYLLLFVSLIGCLIPRIRLHARNVMSRPLRAPKNLARLAESASFTSSMGVEAYAAAARKTLGRRWRVEGRREGESVVTLSAEKGYSRETGNLLFHVALLCSLVLVVIGRLYSYEMTYLVEQGNGFCNSAFPDSARLGRMAQDGVIKPPPFCLTVDRFDSEYLANGQPSQFDAKVTYQDDIRSTTSHQASISVNNPLRMQGDRVYLVGHGFSPEIKVRFPDGQTRDLIADFAPTDEATLLSEGAFEATRASGVGEIGVEGFFAPTPIETADGVISSSSPKVNNPVLGIFVYTGTLHPTGQPQPNTSLDKTKLTKIGQKNLKLGETYTPTGSGVTVTFVGWKPWVTLQVSHDPAQGYLLVSAAAMVVGLIGSLGVRRRRLWLRISPRPAGSGDDPAGHSPDTAPTVIEVGAIARSDRGNFTEEFGELVRRLQTAAQRTAPQREDELVGALSNEKRN